MPSSSWPAISAVTGFFRSSRRLSEAFSQTENQKNIGTRIWRKWWNMHRTSALVLYERGNTGGMGGDRTGEKILFWLAVSALVWLAGGLMISLVV